MHQAKTAHEQLQRNHLGQSLPCHNAKQLCCGTAKAPPSRQQLQEPLLRRVVSLKQHITDVHKVPLDGACAEHQLQKATQGKVIKRPCPDLWPTRILLKLPQILNSSLEEKMTELTVHFYLTGSNKHHTKPQGMFRRATACSALMLCFLTSEKMSDMGARTWDRF